MFVIVNGHELRVPDQQTLRELLFILFLHLPSRWLTTKTLCCRRTMVNVALARGDE